MYDSFQSAKRELVRVSNLNGRYKYFIKSQLKNSLLLERNLIGAYVRSSLIDLKNSIQKSVEGMSSIKLEILKQKKQALYKNVEFVSKKRGNIKNLQRTSKQYFWDFNGEFWADELGDYVFSLKTRCEE
jgi:DNA-binding transcriptional regulator WhiA